MKLRNCLSALIGVAVATLASPAFSQSDKTISVGEVAPIAVIWPTAVAVQKGFFEKHGLNIETTYVGNAAGIIQQLIGGSFDIGITTFDISVRAAANGADFKIIGCTLSRMTASAMADPSIKSAADLKGKTIALPFQKDMSTYLWNRWLREQGVDPTSVDQIFDGSSVNRYAALTSKAAQAALLTSPFDLTAEKDGMVKLLDYGAYSDKLPFLAIAARTDWLEENPDTAKAFMAAVAEGIAWLNDTANEAEAVEIMKSISKQDDDILAATYRHFVENIKTFSPNAAVPDGAVEMIAGVLAAEGEIDESKVGSDLVDRSYLPQ